MAELRDPTLPGNLPAAQAMEMPNAETLPSLTAIWISAARRRATINGVTVGNGQTLEDGSRVVQIKPGYVLIRQNGVNKKLYLVPSVKKPVK
ncbi:MULTISPECIES: hypothetical protein [Methylomonas]|uniref:Uncharacterized protein n=2 Tax=Methylomonas TaxID=416 RepID=A0A140E632_9GAMM|nr:MULTISPECIES: hypothetical protein [Methylomonas]AMK78856.1 hypothetical protein JT25_020610 [Methylomonas denitrificans]OAI02130.1 hypothetical protein A1342_02540 [Methylomonas methanica]